MGCRVKVLFCVLHQYFFVMFVEDNVNGENVLIRNNCLKGEGAIGRKYRKFYQIEMIFQYFPPLSIVFHSHPFDNLTDNTFV